MKTSRQQVLDVIRTHHLVTATDLSRMMRMTPANARHHLRILHELGVLDVAGERPAPGKGRPSKVYRLSQTLTGHNLGALVEALLSELSVKGDKDASLSSLALRLAGQEDDGEANDAERKLPLTTRLIHAIQHLNELGYDARWEARSTAPRVVFGLCPYREVVNGHPELCQMDTHLVGALTRLRVEQTGKLRQDNLGGTICTFRIRP